MTADSIERIVPDELHGHEATGDETLALHLERYRFAQKHVRPGRLLDLACGVGYGTALLAEGGRVEATGVDISQEAIAYAQKRYASSGVRYVQSDGMTFADPAGFDTIVSIETIEHVPEPKALIQRLAKMLRPGGVFVGSVPTTPSVDANPFHLHDFTERSFRKLFLELGLVEVDCLRQVQPFNPIPLVRGREARSQNLRKNLVGYYLTHPSAVVKRVASTLRYGFSNRYLTVVWRAPAAS